MPGIPKTLAGGFAPLDPHRGGASPSRLTPPGNTKRAAAMSSDQQQQPKKKKRSGSEKRRRTVMNTFRSSPEDRAEMRAAAAAAGLRFGSFMVRLGCAKPTTRATPTVSPDRTAINQFMMRWCASRRIAGICSRNGDSGSAAVISASSNSAARLPGTQMSSGLMDM